MSGEITKLNTDLRPMDEVNDRINKIRTLMKTNMKDSVHYGVIPGCGSKPALLKSGAEMICTLFQFSPEFDISISDFSNGHREYQITTTLYHTPSGLKMGQGVGSCSTMEKKYRYRRENTGQIVPTEYWNTKDKSLLGGDQFSVSKVAGAWYVMHEVEYTNPADYYNTALKMAKKRSLVDAVITATGVSELFTQDIEDMAEMGLIEVKPENPKTKSYKKEPPKKANKSKPKAEPETTDKPTEEELIDFQKKAIKDVFGDKSDFEEWLKNTTANPERDYPGMMNVKFIKSRKQFDFIKGKFHREFPEQKDLLPERDINE